MNPIESYLQVLRFRSGNVTRENVLCAVQQMKYTSTISFLTPKEEHLIK